MKKQFTIIETLNRGDGFTTGVVIKEGYLFTDLNGNRYGATRGTNSSASAWSVYELSTGLLCTDSNPIHTVKRKDDIQAYINRIADYVAKFKLTDYYKRAVYEFSNALERYKKYKEGEENGFKGL